MRITTITTEGQSFAVLTAAEAARIVVGRIEEAALIELASELQPGTAVEMYQPFTVWSGNGDDAELLWSDVDETVQHRLTGDDARRVQGLLLAAGEADPNVFSPEGLADGQWELDIAALLKVDADEAVARLVAHIEDDVMLGDAADLRELVNEVASKNASQRYNNGDGDGDEDEARDEVHGEESKLASDANDGGFEGQARFLIERIGEREAWHAVETVA